MGTMDNEQWLLVTVEIDRETVEEILRESVALQQVIPTIF
jgi:hypothetical protein